MTKGDSHAHPFSHLAAGACALAAVMPTAAAAPVCNTRDKTLELLEGKYQEQIIGLGVTGTGGLVELWTSDGGGTWTIVVSTSQGMSCLVAEGENWRGMERRDTHTEPRV